MKIRKRGERKNKRKGTDRYEKIAHENSINRRRKKREKKEKEEEKVKEEEERRRRRRRRRRRNEMTQRQSNNSDCDHHYRINFTSINLKSLLLSLFIFIGIIITVLTVVMMYEEMPNISQQ